MSGHLVFLSLLFLRNYCIGLQSVIFLMPPLLIMIYLPVQVDQDEGGQKRPNDGVRTMSAKLYSG